MARAPGRRILITGAGSGLGRALALRAGRDGWRVACTDLRPDTAHETLRLVQEAGGSGLFDVLDVTSEASFDEVVARVQHEFGGLDVMVNNAGVATAGTVEDAPLSQWQWVLDVNVLGCVRGVRATLPLLRASPGAHVVNVASFAGIANPPALASYSAAKAAVISISETLRYELAPAGIGVTVACPSFFKTNLLASGAERAPAGASTAPQMERIVHKLMDTATVDAATVADDIFGAIAANRFLVITHGDARGRYHLKRLAPELYFRLARKVTAKFLERPRPAKD